MLWYLLGRCEVSNGNRVSFLIQLMAVITVASELFTPEPRIERGALPTRLEIIRYPFGYVAQNSLVKYDICLYSRLEKRM